MKGKKSNTSRGLGSRSRELEPAQQHVKDQKTLKKFPKNKNPEKPGKFLLSGTITIRVASEPMIRLTPSASPSAKNSKTTRSRVRAPRARGYGLDASPQWVEQKAEHKKPFPGTKWGPIPTHEKSGKKPL